MRAAPYAVGHAALVHVGALDMEGREEGQAGPGGREDQEEDERRHLQPIWCASCLGTDHDSLIM